MFRSVLRKIFEAVANPGLGNPHTPHEVELLTKGLKPVAIISSDEMEELSTVIQSGRIVVAEEIKLPILKAHFIFREADRSHIEKVIQIGDRLRHEKGITQEETKFIKAAFEQKPSSAKESRLAELAWHSLRSELFSYVFKKKENDHKARTTSKENIDPVELIEKCHELFRNGDIPFLVIISENLEFDDPLLAEGYSTLTSKLSSADPPTSAFVVCQADKLSAAQELAAYYYRAIEPEYIQSMRVNGASENEIRDEGSRFIGRTLGYTNNDIAWHIGEKYQSPLLRSMMYLTMPIRNRARLSAMRMQAEDTNESLEV